ncbi:PA14 domain-containing protein [Hymenobacter sp. B81]|uniref:PA14 domain-containing protein n=1 Tax=Hymenobacter sp. B81 TaxID=3344878 RepID=UPI0037DCCE2D
MALPLQSAGTGLTGSYFSNGTLAGAPVLKRLDATIDFDWGKGAPAPELPTDNFSVRWEGLLAAPSTGNYRFIAQSGDEVRLWINGKKVLDTWAGAKFMGGSSVSLAAGEKTTIRIEYTDSEGEAQLQLMWVPPGQAAQPIAANFLYPLGSPTTPDPAGAGGGPVAAVAKPTPKPAAPVAAKPAAKPAPKPAEKPAAKPAPAKAVAKAPAPKPAEPKAKPAKPAKTEEAPVELAAGVYVLTSRTTGKPLEVVDPARPNSRAYQAAAVGSTGAAAPAAANDAPRWRIESLGNGYYRLAVPGNNKVLEVLGSSTSNGADLSLWTYYSGNNQLWRIEPTEHGYYKLLAKHSNKALTAKDSVEGGLQQWRYSGRENQQWKLQPVTAEESAPAIAATLNRPGVGANQMSLYPNPSNGVVQLAYSLPEPTPVGWVVYNQRGAAVRMSDYRRRPAGAHHQTLELTSLPPGDYYLHLTVGTSTTKQSLMIRQHTPDAPETPAASPAVGSTSGE